VTTLVQVVGVRFKKAGKVYYFDPAEYPIAAGEKVVVETARGVEYGEVAVGPKNVTEDQVVQPLKKVIRVGNEKDALLAAENKRKEKEAYSVAQKKIQTHTLDMNLVDVEFTFDGSKIIFYFTAEGRVDFRELVRDLAGVFRTRIEMRQIGVRDEAKLLGGIGPCGRILCCTSFLGDFAPVSIRMAKDQNLSLNPSKISGLCGRLMCCLRYEQDTYEAAKKDPTLSPGYVPPALKEMDLDSLADLEDHPTPAIGIRRPETGMSARIARAANLEAEPRREERPDDRRGGMRPPGPRPAIPGILSGPVGRPAGLPQPKQSQPERRQPERRTEEHIADELVAEERSQGQRHRRNRHRPKGGGGGKAQA
jgi:cell fate regulator YaaT (PSP1 superfamily)